MRARGRTRPIAGSLESSRTARASGTRRRSGGSAPLPAIDRSSATRRPLDTVGVPRRAQLIPWRVAGRVTDRQTSADEVVQATGWVFNNETRHGPDARRVRRRPATPRYARTSTAFGLSRRRRRGPHDRRDRLGHRPDDVRVHPPVRHGLRVRSRRRVPRTVPRGGRHVSASSTGCAPSPCPTATRWRSPTTSPTSCSATSRCSTVDRRDALGARRRVAARRPARRDDRPQLPVPCVGRRVPAAARLDRARRLSASPVSARGCRDGGWRPGWPGR